MGVRCDPALVPPLIQFRCRSADPQRRLFSLRALQMQYDLRHCCGAHTEFTRCTQEHGANGSELRTGYRTTALLVSSNSST
jgi:hypothetical protein